MKKDILLKIKNLLSAVDKFGRTSLMDGTEIEYTGEVPEVGAEVYVVTAEGNVLAPDAEHELIDGSKIVTVAGVITEIMPAEEEAPEEAPVEAPVDAELALEAEVSVDMNARIDALEQKIEQLLSLNQSLSSDLTKSLSTLNEKVQNTFAKVEKLANIPGVEKPKKEEIQHNFNKTESKSRAQQIISSKL